MKKFLIGAGALAGTVLAIVVVRERRSKAVLDAEEAAERRLRSWLGQLEGLAYKLRGGHPRYDVDDRTLADRIRSTIGPLEKELDLPHVHVLVVNHIAMLHGAVGTLEEAAAIEDAVRSVAAVRGIESYLHLGLSEGDARPSQGHAYRAPSDGWKRVMASVEAAGVSPGHESSVARAVLVTLTEHLPQGEAHQLVQHLPRDVRSLASAPRRLGPGRPRVRHVSRFVDEVVHELHHSSPGEDLAPDLADRAVRNVFATVQQLVPEEVHDVGAVLPQELREAWEQAATSSEAVLLS